MITLTLIDNGKQLDLPSDVKISIEQNNPMFEEQGDFTLPLELPFSKKNLLLLGFPHRLDIESDIGSIPVLLQAGSLSKRGNMNILDVEEGKSISVSIIFEETVLYKKMDKTMEELFENEIFILPDNRPNTPLGRVEYLEDVLAGEIEDTPFAVFPVATKVQDGEIEKGLNFPDVNISQSGNPNISRLFGHKAIEVQEFFGVVEHPIGYNTTPFLKLNWLLRKTFELLGYELTTNMFDTDSDLKKIVVLNNTCDSLISTHFYLKFLMPTCTIKEFVDTIRYRFGCEFVLSSDKTRISLLTWNEVFESSPIDDYQRVLQSQSSISFVSSKTLKTVSKKIEHESFVNFSTWQDFLKSIGGDYLTHNSWHNVPGEATIFVPILLHFVQTHSGIRVYDIFDYYQGDFEAVELKTKCSECSVLHSSMIEVSALHHTPFVNGSTLPMLFIGSARNCTSQLFYDDELVENKTTGENPLIFCYSHGLLSGDEFEPYNFTYGTSHSNNNLGDSNGNLHLTMRGEKGLFNRFLKKYDDFLRNKPHLLPCGLDLKAHEILDYYFYRPVLIKGVKCMPSKLQYEVTSDSIKVVSAEFKKM